jgi:hypothetical protein
MNHSMTNWLLLIGDEPDICEVVARLLCGDNPC